ncbi:hypothetical protein K469DRAFT_679398 [Zopfia rhizophila CBS 207.26]|uniref:Rhodopsin domain-containing protein n=1 Tax=Zopfia rhizophila CBS 207.26 TaxID=1314779 RepID=A0A6A6D8M9_9PEZI|nr:hypothetical protein K469DRAFT_679398 [Zopfia rhizophila CBS 207.26]
MEDLDRGPQLIAISSVCRIVTLLIYGFRMYTRIRPVNRLGWDDYAITAAIVCAIVDWAFIILSVVNGIGRHQHYLSPLLAKNGNKWIILTYIPHMWVIAFVKISIAFLLARFRDSLKWKVFLYGMIVLQIVASICATVMQTLLCRPLAAWWDPPNYPNAKCFSYTVGRVNLYINSAIVIATDFIFAMLPFTFILKIHRSLREKIIILILMSMGLLASAASGVKISFFKTYATTSDKTWVGSHIYLWVVIEETAATTAACIPCLKGPFNRVLRRTGLLLSGFSSTTAGYHHSAYDGEESHQLSKVGTKGTIRLEHGSGAYARSDESILRDERSDELDESELCHPDPGENGIVRITEISIQTGKDS